MAEELATTTHAPGAPIPGAITPTAAQMRDTVDQLRIIREFIYSELKDGEDFGRVAGCGDKPTLLQPGAQKICMFFNVYPEYAVQTVERQSPHVEYIVTTTLISRTTGMKVGSGVGSCSTLEKKYRYRKQDRVCPKCGAESIRSSKTGGFFCGVRAGGCGASFASGDPTIVNQKVGLVENEDVADSYNTVLKMAKKRSFVDATLSMSCISEFFTQDLEDRGEVQPHGGPPRSYNVSGRTDSAPPKTGKIAGFRQNGTPTPADDPPTPKGDVRSPGDWRDHPHAVAYNDQFEVLVQKSGTLDTEREPAFRAYVKNEWVKLTRARGFEARPDRVPADAFEGVLQDWRLSVEKKLTEKADSAAG